MKQYSEEKLNYKITRKENIIKKQSDKTLTKESWESVRNKIDKLVTKEIKTIADLQESVASKNIAIDFLTIAKGKVEESYPVVKMYNDLTNTISYLNKEYTKTLGGKTDEINWIVIEDIVNFLNTHLQTFFACAVDFKNTLLNKINNSIKAGDKLKRYVRYIKFKEDIMDLYNILNDDIDFSYLKQQQLNQLIEECNNVSDIKNFINKIKLEDLQAKVIPAPVATQPAPVITQSTHAVDAKPAVDVKEQEEIKPMVFYFTNQQDRLLLQQFLKINFTAKKIGEKIILEKI